MAHSCCHGPVHFEGGSGISWLTALTQASCMGVSDGMSLLEQFGLESSSGFHTTV